MERSLIELGLEVKTTLVHSFGRVPGVEKGWIVSRRNCEEAIVVAKVEHHDGWFWIVRYFDTVRGVSKYGFHASDEIRFSENSNPMPVRIGSGIYFMWNQSDRAWVDPKKHDLRHPTTDT